MNIDIESIKQALATLGTTLSLLKQAKDLLPDNANKQKISEAIDNAEKQLTSAETEAARSIGYKICHNHYPAGIMLSADEINWKCPTCGNEIKPKEPQQTKHPASGNKAL